MDMNTAGNERAYPTDFMTLDNEGIRNKRMAKSRGYQINQYNKLKAAEVEPSFPYLNTNHNMNTSVDGSNIFAQTQNHFGTEYPTTPAANDQKNGDQQFTSSQHMMQRQYPDGTSEVSYSREIHSSQGRVSMSGFGSRDRYATVNNNHSDM